MGNIGFTELILILILSVGFGLIPTIFYLISLQDTLNLVKPENRRMDPGQVWLTLIPLFGIIWQFIMVGNIADSLKAEFQSRNIQLLEERPGYSLGLAYSILTCVALIPIVGILTGIAAFICWLLYWIKISGFKTQLLYTKPA